MSKTILLTSNQAALFALCIEPLGNRVNFTGIKIPVKITLMTQFSLSMIRKISIQLWRKLIYPNRNITPCIQNRNIQKYYPMYPNRNINHYQKQKYYPLDQFDMKNLTFYGRVFVRIKNASTLLKVLYKLGYKSEANSSVEPQTFRILRIF